MKYFLFFLLVISQISYGQQAPEASMPIGPGCYAKCLIPDQYEFFITPIFEYIGDDFESSNVEYGSILIEDASSKWVRKGVDKRCKSSNPEDCLVWCLVEGEAEYYQFYEVLDTALTEDYKITEIESRELISHGGYTEWKEVLCDNHITSEFYQDLQAALIDFGYISEIEKSDDPGFSPSVKAALVKFQKKNSLPVGQLDFETLDYLGVDY